MALSVSVLTRFDCKTEKIWYLADFGSQLRPLPRLARGTRWIYVPQNICSFLANFCWLGDFEKLICPWWENVTGKQTIHVVWCDLVCITADNSDNSVIDASALNGSRLHLHAKGSSLLAVPFIKVLSFSSDKFNQSRKGFRSPAIQRLGKLLMEPGNCPIPARNWRRPR